MLELRDVPPDRLPSAIAAAVDRMTRLRAAARFLAVDEARRQIEGMAERTRDHADVLDVVDGDAVVGAAWLARVGEELLVHDLVLDDPSRVAELMPALVGRARSAGVRMLGVGVNPGDPSRAALAEQPGFVSRATNMALPLDGEIPDSGGLELHRMTQAEFDAFLTSMVVDYAADLVATGLSGEEAAQRSVDSMEELLPDGQASPGMEFFTARLDGDPVGRLWLSTRDPMAFVYDVAVDEDQRRKGYGAAIMNAGARWCRDQGHPVLGLNVFAHNPGARALYDGLGYQVTQDYRALDLPDVG